MPQHPFTDAAAASDEVGGDEATGRQGLAEGRVVALVLVA